MDPLLKGWENSVRKGKSHKLQQKDSKTGTIRSLSQPDDGGIEIEMTAHFRKERRPIATEFQSILFDTCTRSSRNTRSTRIKDLGDASAHFSASINRKGLFYTTHLSRNPLIFASQNHRAVSRYMYQSTR